MATEQQKAVKNFKKFMRGLDEIDRVSEDDRERIIKEAVKEISDDPDKAKELAERMRSEDEELLDKLGPEDRKEFIKDYMGGAE